jgi:hypothetical protein
VGDSRECDQKMKKGVLRGGEGTELQPEGGWKRGVSVERVKCKLCVGLHLMIVLVRNITV